MHTAFLIIDLETYWTGIKVKDTLGTESSASYIKDKKICLEINQDIDIYIYIYMHTKSGQRN